MRMIARGARLQIMATLMLLAACSSAPTHFYTLLPAAPVATTGAAAAPFLIDVLPVVVPAQVDQLELLVHETEQRVSLLDSEHWAAPLAAELRAALASDLVGALATRDVHGLAHDSALPLFSIQINVRSFESWPASHASIGTDWSVRSTDRVPITCSSSATEPVGPGYDALVQGHQRVLAHIAGDIAVVLRELASGEPATCP